MGTNFYLRTNVCSHCDRYDETHICHSMTSWDTVRRYDDASETWVVSVGSWKEWKALLLTGGGLIFDEYGRFWLTVDFIAAVEATPADARRWQYDWMVRRDPRRVSDGPAIDMTWLDADGFTFSGHGFS